MTPPKAVVLLSGGIDSTVALSFAIGRGCRCYGLTFDYGQRHAFELTAAKNVAERYGINHLVTRLAIPDIAASPLTDSSQPIPTHDRVEQIPDGIAATYVPGRNTMFLAHAFAYTESLGATAIYIGANATDAEGYPDCRPGYIAAFQSVLDRAYSGSETSGPRLVAPLLRMTKRQIIRWAIDHHLDLSATSSCYTPAADGRPCGHCDACLVRADAFSFNEIPDPIA